MEAPTRIQAHGEPPKTIEEFIGRVNSKTESVSVARMPSLPWKRLIWAAVGNDYYVVHYERGGIDHSFHILVARLPKNDAKSTVIWRALGRPFKDYAAFLDALRNGKLDDGLNYPH
jgi:hypothetical protein